MKSMPNFPGVVNDHVSLSSSGEASSTCKCAPLAISLGSYLTSWRHRLPLELCRHLVAEGRGVECDPAKDGAGWANTRLSATLGWACSSDLVRYRL